MIKKGINIIAFDCPYPPGYGGVIDVYYKIKTLHSQGVKIVLHCFHKNALPSRELETICDQVYYYPRKKGVRYQFSSLPYVVKTRIHADLLKNLQSNDYPILFEGLHTCGLIRHPELENRKKVVRMHNVEHHYYRELYRASAHPVRKLYYLIESIKLKRFEKVIDHAQAVAAISPNDFDYFKSRHLKVSLVPAFHPFEEVISLSGTGDYFLYNGNLAVEENQKAVDFLLKKIMPFTHAMFVVAGKNPSRDLEKSIQKYSNVSLEANPSYEKMHQLLTEAHGCILPTFQGTGLKLKLLYSLFAGRHVICNLTMVNNTSLESLCTIADSPEEMIKQIQKIGAIEFTQEMINNRKEKLEEFSNEVNGRKLMEIV